MIYEIVRCPHCHHQCVWDRRGRGADDFGWYCRHWREPGHPDGFYGYHTGASVECVKVVPHAPVNELVGVVRAIAPIVRESGETGLDYALAEYQKAVGTNG